MTAKEVVLVAALGATAGVAGELVTREYAFSHPDRLLQPQVPMAEWEKLRGDYERAVASLGGMKERLDSLSREAIEARSSLASISSQLTQWTGQERKKEEPSKLAATKALEASPPVGESGVSFSGASEEQKRRVMAALGVSRDPVRASKVDELRRLTLDQRWERAEQALSLTTDQVTALKAAIAVRQEKMHAAFTVSEVEADDGTPVLVATPDHALIQDIQRAYATSVSHCLNQQQEQSWKDDGFEMAIGGPRARAVSVGR